MRNIIKWKKGYIDNLDLRKIEWIKLNFEGLDKFLKENYYDEELYQYVLGNRISIYPPILGMTYLSIEHHLIGKNYSYFLGIINNNIGKKTIVCAISYYERYFISKEHSKPITYISTVEVNSFFRNLGLSKLMFENFFKIVNFEQHILISEQSEMGTRCNVFDNFIKIALSNDFPNFILEDSYNCSSKQIREMLGTKPKVKQCKK